MVTITKIISPVLLTGWGYFFSTTTLQIANGGSELTMLEQLLSLGIGGIIAALVLWWKRQDDKEHKEELTKHKQEILRITEKHQESVAKIVESGSKREDRMIEALHTTSEAVKEFSVIVDRVASRSDIDTHLIKILNKLEDSNQG